MAPQTDATRPVSWTPDALAPPSTPVSAVPVAPVARWPRVRHGVLLVLCAMYFIAYVDRVNVSVAWAPEMPYLRSRTKNGTPEIPICAAWASSARTASA